MPADAVSEWVSDNWAPDPRDLALWPKLYDKVAHEPEGLTSVPEVG